MKKLFASLLVSLTLVFCITPVATAAPISTTTVETRTEISPRAEETRWYFLTYNGKNQMRLWSITESRWLTDWITIN